MKRMMSCVMLIGLLFLASACKNDGRKAPAVPTPASVSWAVTGLTANTTTPLVAETILLTASVTMDGTQAPDGTVVEFVSNAPTTDYGYFSSANNTYAEVETNGGSASIYFIALIDGTYTIQARVVDAVRQLAITYKQPDQSNDLQIYRISPDEGPLSGGQMAYITGKNIWPPVDVYFLVGGTQYHAITVDVGASGETLTVTTPAINGVDQALEWTADLVVESRVGIGDGDTYTLPDAYRFQPAISEPIIYVLVPDHGSPRGGETVNIIGQNFIAPVEVALGDLEAGQETVSPDGQLISFLTPQYSVTDLTADVAVSVTVRTQAGTAHERIITKSLAWVWQADIVTPVITGIDPPAGPIDGGTVVTLFGSGFEIPLQVYFGDRLAVVTSVTEDRIVCVSPDMSTSLTSPPFTVSVYVTNLETGLSSNSVSFTYGETLHITGNNPSEGGRGTTVVIYGSGFEDPLTVRHGANVFEVLAVSGSEVVTKAPQDTPTSCVEQSGTFTITLLDSGLQASGGLFAYYADNPRIYSVNPPIVTESAGGLSTSPPTITILGNNFYDNMIVSFGDYVLNQTDYSISDGNTIVVQVPTPDEMGLTFDESPCVTGGGIQGTRFIPTQVDISVTNLPANCADEIAGGLTYEPADTSCVARPNLGLSTTALTLPDWAFGSCSTPATQLTLVNNGTGTLTVNNLSVVGPFALVSPPTPTPPFTIDAGISTLVGIQFCPPAEGGLTYTGQLIISSDDPTDPLTYVDLTGTELASPIITTTPYSSGGNWTFVGNITVGTCSASEFLIISNTGDGPSNITAAATAQFSIIAPPPLSPLPAGSSTQIELQFCPSAVGGQIGALTISCDDPTNCPVVINLAGTGV